MSSLSHQPESPTPAAEPGVWPDHRLTETVYDAEPEISRPLRLLGNVFRSAWDGRELAWRLFVRNLRGMYRQTALGLLWIFLPPLANTAIWVFLRAQRVLDFDFPAAVHPTVYILTGMILWQAFIDAFQMPLNALNQNRSMISKLNFPREALLAEGLGEVLFNTLVRLLLLVPALLLYGAHWSWAAWLAPLAAVLMVLFATGLGLLIMPIGSLYQDVSRFLSVGLPFWMILTPIIYAAPTEFPGTLLNWLNPASPLLMCARDLLLLGSCGNPAALWYGLAAIPLFLLGLIVYRLALPALIERMTS